MLMVFKLNVIFVSSSCEFFFVSNNHLTIQGAHVFCHPCSFPHIVIVISIANSVLAMFRFFVGSNGSRFCHDYSSTIVKIALRICTNAVQVIVQVSVQNCQKLSWQCLCVMLTNSCPHSTIVHCCSFRKCLTKFLTTIFNLSFSHACALTC